jgi:flagellar hook-basal body complex protein FliE
VSGPIAAINGGMAGIAPIAGGGRATGPLGIEGGGGASPASGDDLGASFTKALSDARGLEQNASQAAEKFASGDPTMGIHEVMIASEKANIALRYATTLKNKALESYKELMNTQV